MIDLTTFGPRCFLKMELNRMRIIGLEFRVSEILASRIMSDSFLAAFSAITGTGAFHSSGSAPFFFPMLNVKGLGELALPLAPSQAKELIALAEAAPYGQGEKTVLDESVRKCWQLGAAEFSIKAASWEKYLAATVEKIREDMGITGKISATPYKLLVYGKGGHFKPHRDTEKLDAMFGTLIIALPSAHEGGQLFVRHEGREIEIDFSSGEHLHEFQHAAFFADCEHEVVPVRSGYRCCLVYNLHLDEGNPDALNLSLTVQAKSLLPSLEKLKTGKAGKLTAVLLEHSYTEANLSLNHLKGNDMARAQALLAAAQESGFTAHLALVIFHQSGQLDESQNYGQKGRRHYYDDDDEDPEVGTMGEVDEESLTIEHWRNSSDLPVELGRYCIEMEDLISKDEITDDEPDEKESEGYTGNAGCTMDYWYRRAAIVLWAKEDQEDILCRYNFRGACAALAELAHRNGETKTSSAAFQRLARAVIACFSDAPPEYGYHSHGTDYSSSPFAITLNALAAAGDRGLLDSLLARVSADSFIQCDATLWGKLHKAFGIEIFAPIYAQLIADGPENNRRSLFQILDELPTREGGAGWARTIASHLARLSFHQTRASYSPTRDPLPPGDSYELRILLAASHLLETPADRKAALSFILADTSLLYTRGTLGPVLQRESIRALASVKNSLFPQALTFAQSLLEAEIARPLPPFPDWTRPCPPVDSIKLSQPGSYFRPDPKPHQALTELAAFMADPAVQSHDFRYAQDIRTTLETYIRQHLLDLDHTTIRKGTPHTLACTKNDKSYQHALATRANDEALLKALRK